MGAVPSCRHRLGMSKRVRRVAFADEVQVEDKRRREDETQEHAEDEHGERKERSECALIRNQLARARTVCLTWAFHCV